MKQNEKTFQRFSFLFRLQHIVLAASTLVLIFTGIPLWFLGKPEHIWWTADTFEIFGGLQGITAIHRCAAFGLMAIGAYHIFYTIFLREGRRELLNFLPKIKDVTDVIQNSLYFLGISKNPPKFDRFSYIEKFDYWAVYWGCVIMIGSGLCLMFPEKAAKMMPFMTYDLAAEIHAGEALLAALAIFVWHFYNVHFNPSKFPGSMLWLHGKITETEIKHEHPLEYDKLIQAEKEDKK